MQNILSNIIISVNDKLYVKNPETSDLGKKIIEQSILLIDEIGFENFTFKKSTPMKVQFTAILKASTN